MPRCFVPDEVVVAGFARTNRPDAGAVSVPSGFDAPPAPDFEVVVERAATGGAHRRAEDAERAPGLLHEPEHRLLVPAGLGRDLRVVRVVRDRQLDGVREDPVGAVLEVARRPGADVQVARLLGPVAVGRGHVLRDLGQRRVIVGRSCRTGCSSACSRTATRSVGRTRGTRGGTDLLATADDPAGEEVAHGPGLGRRERLRAAVCDRLRVRAGPAAAAPSIAEVPVEVGPDGVSCRGSAGGSCASSGTCRPRCRTRRRRGSPGTRSRSRGCSRCS